MELEREFVVHNALEHNFHRLIPNSIPIIVKKKVFNCLVAVNVEFQIIAIDYALHVRLGNFLRIF